MQKLAHGEDGDSVVAFEAEQVEVACENQLSAGFDGAFEDHVVFGITADAVQGACYVGMNCVYGVVVQNREDFVIGPGEFTGKNRAHFRYNLLANSNRIVSEYGVEGGLRSASEVQG